MKPRLKDPTIYPWQLLILATPTDSTSRQPDLRGTSSRVLLLVEFAGRNKRGVGGVSSQFHSGPSLPHSSLSHRLLFSPSIIPFDRGSDGAGVLKVVAIMGSQTHTEWGCLSVARFCRSCFGKFPRPNGQYCRYLLPRQALATQTEKNNKI